MTPKALLFAIATLLACSLPIGSATAQEDRIGERLLAAAEGLQMPSSEADSVWHLISYGGVSELPVAGAFEELSGCPEGCATRSDFDETLARLGTDEPWMDAGRARSARGFRKLEKVFGREFGEELTVYRCEAEGQRSTSTSLVLLKAAS